MNRPMCSAHSLALVAVCLCVCVPPVLAQECLGEIGTLSGTPAELVAASSRYACFSDGGTLVIADLSNPAQPQRLGEIDLPHVVSDIEISGDFVYAMDGYYATGLDRGLHIIDISAPTAPVLVSFHPTLGQAWGVEVSGDYAYVADGEFGLLVLNISNPSAPTIAGAVDTPGTAFDVVKSGDYAYVADFGGVTVVRVINPAVPQALSTCETTGASAIEVFPRHVFVVGETSESICDISDPWHPFLEWEHVLDPLTGFADVAVLGRTAYTTPAHHSSAGPWGVTALDLSDPSAPIVQDYVGVGWGSGSGIDVTSSLVLVGGRDQGLKIYSVCSILDDSFESGDTTAWSAAVP